MSAKQLAETLEIEEAAVEDAVDVLEAALDEDSGLQLMRVAGGYQICTRPEYADYCAMILQPAKKRLSKAALETLAVVAYRQPCTMPEVEAVRGVSVDGVMKTLIERGLVKEAGRKQTPGRPNLYATTAEFLEYFRAKRYFRTAGHRYDGGGTVKAWKPRGSFSSARRKATAEDEE